MAGRGYYLRCMICVRAGRQARFCFRLRSSIFFIPLNTHSAIHAMVASILRLTCVGNKSLFASPSQVASQFVKVKVKSQVNAGSSKSSQVKSQE